MDAREINAEVRALKERAKALSGFWIGEIAAAIYSLEWAAGKRDAPPSEVLGGAGGGHEKIAANLMKLVEQSRKGGPKRGPSAKDTSPAKKRKTGSPGRRS
ncbi:MAG: hypothetical protein ABR576_01090 [Thermoanaerobaculia bacterium]